MAGVMGVKPLLRTYKDLRPVTGTHIKSWACVCNLSAGEAGTGGSLGLAGWPA